MLSFSDKIPVFRKTGGTILQDGNPPAGDVALGTDDGYVSVTKTRESKIATVHCFYAVLSEEDRLSTPLGQRLPQQQRQFTDNLISNLTQQLGGLALTSSEDSKYASRFRFTKVYGDYIIGDLYSSESDSEPVLTNCVLTDITVTDVGFYAVNFTATFTQVKQISELSSLCLDYVEYGGVKLGTYGADISVRSGRGFRTINVSSVFTGSIPVFTTTHLGRNFLAAGGCTTIQCGVDWKTLRVFRRGLEFDQIGDPICVLKNPPYEEIDSHVSLVSYNPTRRVDGTTEVSFRFETRCDGD